VGELLSGKQEERGKRVRDHGWRALIWWKKPKVHGERMKGGRTDRSKKLYWQDTDGNPNVREGLKVRQEKKKKVQRKAKKAKRPRREKQDSAARQQKKTLRKYSCSDKRNKNS